MPFFVNFIIKSFAFIPKVLGLGEDYELRKEDSILVLILVGVLLNIVFNLLNNVLVYR